MKKVEIIKSIAELFCFRTVTDKEGNEYVILGNSKITELNFDIDDKTQFEAVENHVHLIDKVKKSDFDILTEAGRILGEAQLDSLKSKYPEKEFCVFVTVEVGESMIIRFHQVWQNEAVYYNPDDFNSANTKVLMFRK